MLETVSIFGRSVHALLIPFSIKLNVKHQLMNCRNNCAVNMNMCAQLTGVFGVLLNILDTFQFNTSPVSPVSPITCGSSVRRYVTCMYVGCSLKGLPNARNARHGQYLIDFCLFLSKLGVIYVAPFILTSGLGTDITGVPVGC